MPSPRIADDHTLVGREGDQKPDTEREVYAFYSLKGTFGYYLSGPKTLWEVTQRFRTLGLECDTVRQCWLVPEDRRETYREIAGVLVAQLKEGNPDPWTLSRFAGKTVYYRRACDSLKYHQNLQYAVLSNRSLKREEVPTDRRWWIDPHVLARKLSKKLRKLLTCEILVCVALIAADQIHPFVSNEHVALKWEGNTATLYTDTTLHAYGAVLRGGGRDRPEVIYGNIMPEEVAGVWIVKMNTGVIELTGLLQACRAIDNTPELLERVKNRMLDIHMDNFEDVRLLQTGAVRGQYTVEKQQLLLEFRHYLWKWNTSASYHYVNTAENPADEPSRLQYEGEIRLIKPLFNMLWAEHRGFDVDAMASEANRQHRPDGEGLPYISKGPDPESRSINVFNERFGRKDDRDRERVYINPPFVLTRAVIWWMKECRSTGVAVVKDCAQPWPAWRHELANHSEKCWKLAVPHSEGRRGGLIKGGFVVLHKGPGLVAYAFDFEREPSRGVEVVEELELTLG